MQKLNKVLFGVLSFTSASILLYMYHPKNKEHCDMFHRRNSNNVKSSSRTFLSGVRSNAGST